MTPEGKVKKKISKLLEQYKAYYFMPVQTGYGKKTVDYLVCYKGHFIGIEAKAPGKTPTRLQWDCLEKIGAARGYVTVIDGDASLANFEELLKCLA